MVRLFNSLLIILLALTLQVAAQPVYERHTAEVNQYLARMAQKGLIFWEDNIQPLRMDIIAAALDSLQARAPKLSGVEKSELSFYQNFYRSVSNKYQLGYKNEDFSFKLFPVIAGQLHSSDSIQYFKRSIGINLYGTISKRWGYQLSFQDITEKGSLIDTAKKSIAASMETGFVKNSLFNNGILIHMKSDQKIINKVNKIAPEHLELNTKNYKKVVGKIKNAGSICLGKYAVMAMTDYNVGSNHVLPTNSSARYSSGVSVNEFYKRISYINLSKKGIETLGPSVITLANYEGLAGHAKSVEKRIRRK